MYVCVRGRVVCLGGLGFVCVCVCVVVRCALGVWVSNFVCGAWVGWLGRRPLGHSQPNIMRNTPPTTFVQ